MKIQQNISLKKYNTFGIDVIAKRFIAISSYYDLQEVLKKEKDIFLLSGGSNLLLTKTINKLVIYLNIKGISIDRQTEDVVYLTVNAGENWHEFVLWCIHQNFGGLENLSLIPGNVGTCPIQNIGAYGVEVKDTITKVEAIEINSGKKLSFSNKDCNFGYRNSVFKNELKGKIVITSVGFKLTTKNHQLKTSYGAIETALQEKNILKPTIKNISDAVIAIRKAKLPDPKKIGNSGSFFKNPVISKSDFKILQQNYPKVPFYEVRPFDSAQDGIPFDSAQDDINYKIPAGWLIEQAGFKGKRFGEAGVHKNQALVLVNYGNATGKEVYNLAKKIQQTILNQFSIKLEIEVNVI